MKKTGQLIPSKLMHLSALCAIAVVLTACGGSAGDTTDTQGVLGGVDPTLDSDGDGLTDVEEGQIGTDPFSIDSDGDGLDDGFEQNTVLSSPLSADSDLDGLSDALEFNVLLTSPTLVDSDFDGVEDGDEDSDGDGSSNANEVINGTDPIVADVTQPPPPDQCDDAISADDEWTNNCVLRRFGTFARSSYVQGVQRILFCQGHGQGSSSILAFSDGIFGPNTQQAVRDFQTSTNLDPDGIVGMDTWNALFNTLSLIGSTSTSQGFEAHSVDGCDANTSQFFQEVDGIDLLGWTMALTPGSNTRVPFSSGPPQ